MSSLSELESLRLKYRLPGLALIATQDNTICDLAAVGFRKEGSSVPVTTIDKFHIGSCTKPLTATLAAILVEEGKLSWETTVSQALPNLQSMHADFASVTLDQLLRHKAGLSVKPPKSSWDQAWRQIGSPMAQRAEFVASVLSEAPELPPGSQFLYSNQSYAVAGHMLETIAGQPWEELLRSRVFEPLGMRSAGFGAPDNTLAQPWGHSRQRGNTVPSLLDNPPAIAPAATVHCSLEDLATFAHLHIDRGEVLGILTPASFRHMHALQLDDDSYACGWMSVPRDWAAGQALHHSGSNTLWHVSMWLAPERRFVVIAATNVGGDDAEQACDEAVALLINRRL
eukprot:gene46005-56308_t